MFISWPQESGNFPPKVQSGNDLLTMSESPILFFFTGHFLLWSVDIPGVLDSFSSASHLFPSEQGSSSKEQLPTSHPLYVPSLLAGIPGVPGSSTIFITGIPETPFLG
uniref:Uncharacterized protein n=1 Tax=Timema monikensis TaxID=170555 RepID=A0A7R9DZT7_9NEOP|nr:unnamed protein product [Timema monikensis]